MVIAVASGKGGTGKTTVAVNLALAMRDERPVQFLDCDVEEPNAHFFLKPAIEDGREVFKLVPEVDESRCTYCGTCARVCAYRALAVVKDAVLVFPELCHGCGACGLLCPEKAIREVGQRVGVVESGHAGALTFLQGRLDIGQAMSPPLVRALKKRLDRGRTVVIDAPPGTSCPMIESVKGSDVCLLVTEPTPFGLHDLELAAGAVKTMGISRSVIINRAAPDEGNRAILNFCAAEGVPILMTIPFDRGIAEAYARGDVLIDAIPAYRERFVELFKKIGALGP